MYNTKTYTQIVIIILNFHYLVQKILNIKASKKKDELRNLYGIEHLTSDRFYPLSFQAKTHHKLVILNLPRNTYNYIRKVGQRYYEGKWARVHVRYSSV